MEIDLQQPLEYIDNELKGDSFFTTLIVFSHVGLSNLCRLGVEGNFFNMGL